jgi:hypothetical protein
MSFNFDYNAQDSMGGGDDRPPLPAGIYDGKVEKATIKQSKTSGESYINLQLRLSNNRVLFDRVGLQAKNPKAKDIAQKKVKNIVVNGLAKTSEKKSVFTSLEEIASYLTGIPVKIKYEHKGKNEKGYDVESLFYNSVDDANRIVKDGKQAAVKGPSY